MDSVSYFHKLNWYSLLMSVIPDQIFSSQLVKLRYVFFSGLQKDRVKEITSENTLNYLECPHNRSISSLGLEDCLDRDCISWVFSEGILETT